MFAYYIAYIVNILSFLDFEADLSAFADGAFVASRPLMRNNARRRLVVVSSESERS